MTDPDTTPLPSEPAAPPTSPSNADRRDAIRRAAIPGMILVIGLVVGGGIGYAIGHDNGHGQSRFDGRFGGPGRLPAFGGINRLPVPGFGLPGGTSTQRGSQTNGTLSAKTSTSVTVKASNGISATYSVSTSTQIERDGKSATIDDLKVGDRISVIATSSSASGPLQAVRIGAGTSASLPNVGGFGLGGPGAPPQNGAPSNS